MLFNKLNEFSIRRLYFEMETCIFNKRSLCRVYQTKQMFFLIYDTCTTVDLII